LTGGLLTLIFYLMIFQRGFSSIGTARKLAIADRNQEWFLWCLGSSLFATVVAHFGINNMAQGIMGVFPLLASISVATFETKQATVRGVEPAPAPAPASVSGRAGTDLLLAKSPKKQRPVWSKVRLGPGQLKGRGVLTK
jgi:hypothetical protein